MKFSSLLLLLFLLSFGYSQLFGRRKPANQRQNIFGGKISPIKKPQPIFQNKKQQMQQQQIVSQYVRQFQVDQKGYLVGRPALLTTKDIMSKGSNYLNIMTRVKKLIRNRMDVITIKQVFPQIVAAIPGAATQIGSLLPMAKDLGGKNNKISKHIDQFQKKFYKTIFGFEKNYQLIRQTLPGIINSRMPRIRSYGFSNYQIQQFVDNVYKISKALPIPGAALR